MHIPSLALCATALLSRTATAFFLLKTTHPDFEAFGFARIQYRPYEAVAGFSTNPAQPYAKFSDAENGADIGSTFLLRAITPGTWAVLSREAASPESGDITGPFEIAEQDGRFLYKGDNGPYYWNLCPRADEHELYLANSTLESYQCVGDVTLVAEHFTGA